jgi:hypothetical protein
MPRMREREREREGLPVYMWRSKRPFRRLLWFLFELPEKPKTTQVLWNFGNRVLKFSATSATKWNCFRVNIQYARGTQLCAQIFVQKYVLLRRIEEGYAFRPPSCSVTYPWETNCCLSHVGLLLGLLLNPVEGGDMFLRNIGWISTFYTTLYARDRSPQPATSVLKTEATRFSQTLITNYEITISFSRRY